MKLDIRALKAGLEAKIKRRIGEFFLPSEQQLLLKKLFLPVEQDQLSAAQALGKMPDVNLLCLLQFYLQDSFLDDLFASLAGGEFRRNLAERNAIKFHSRLAAAIMLSDRQFFDYVLQEIGSPAVPVEERCDLICVAGAVFEAFGADLRTPSGAAETGGAGFLGLRPAGARAPGGAAERGSGGSSGATAVSQQAGLGFVRALVGVLGNEKERDEVKAACALSLKKALSNPNISTNLGPQLAASAFSSLAPYKDI